MRAGSASSIAGTLVDAFAARRPLGAGSFIVTLYGDAIVPRGGLVWLGNVIAVCAEVGISETLVRTAVSRLVAAGHLSGERDGRRSFYRLTAASRQDFESAAEIIYGGPKQSHGQEWSLLVLPSRNLTDLERRDLVKQGHGLLGPSLALRAQDSQLPTSIAGALRFNAAVLDKAGREQLRQLAADAWSLDSLSLRYRQFRDSYAPLLAALEADTDDPLDAQLCLALRLLLVHDYRHVVLDDPGLPQDLLPQDWLGPVARDLFVALYAQLNDKAERAIAATFIDMQGPLVFEPKLLSRRLSALGLARVI